MSKSILEPSQLCLPQPSSDHPSLFWVCISFKAIFQIGAGLYLRNLRSLKFLHPLFPSHLSFCPGDPLCCRQRFGPDHHPETPTVCPAQCLFQRIPCTSYGRPSWFFRSGGEHPGLSCRPIEFRIADCGLWIFHLMVGMVLDS